MTSEEIMAAVVAVSAPPADDPGVSVAEYAAHQGITKAQAFLRLTKAVENGKLVEGWACKHDGANGQLRRVRVYRPA